MYSPQYPVINETVTFTATNATEGTRTIECYEWDFGDGATGSSRIVTHAYSSAGDYAVKLIMTDDEGATSSCSELITVPIG
jgi:PKD repeat protein